MRLHVLPLILAASITSVAAAQRPETFSQTVRQYIAIDTPTIVIRNVRVIDGTGAAPRENQTVVIANGKIASVSNSEPSPRTEDRGQRPRSEVGHGLDSRPTPNSGFLVIDGTGKTVMPGLVMVHEHFFYPPTTAVGMPTYTEHAYSFPRLYLGAGITTARTAGSMSPYSDINLKHWIDSGTVPGPKLDITGPYLSGAGSPLAEFHILADSADARRTVRYWADLGMTSFKAYMWITRDELRAATDEAHKRGVKITGHLCSVTFREAADIGIDNLEHGIIVASDFIGSAKQPDVCPPQQAANPVGQIDPATDTTLRSVIETLVRRHVAVTSTLAVFESFVPNRPATPARVLDVLSNDAKLRYLQQRAAIAGNTASPWTKIFANELRFEKMFVDAGGTLLVGTDPTGYGGVVAGLSSQRAVELLVEAGFTPLEAIHIATSNGAIYLGRADRVGTIGVGKDADLLLIAGDPSARISDIEKVEIVFKDGVGYDSAKLIASAKGLVGSQ